MARFQIWDLSTPSKQAPSKLSENIKSLNLDHQNSSYRRRRDGSSSLKSKVYSIIRTVSVVAGVMYFKETTLHPFFNSILTLPHTHIHSPTTHTGPGPLEALAHGCVFLQPSFTPPHSGLNTNFFGGKPTARELTSQVPYLEHFVGKPYVSYSQSSPEYYYSVVHVFCGWKTFANQQKILLFAIQLLRFGKDHVYLLVLVHVFGDFYSCKVLKIAK